ncbi:MAG: hypothetical protein NC433_09365 [Clostridiales bacterium]|nr:hypothetical protein [Clostridiales bacterium]
MQANTNQTLEIIAKRTAKNSVFLDLFKDKKNCIWRKATTNIFNVPAKTITRAGK